MSLTDPSPSERGPSVMSWALLLAKWTEWARASLALPPDAEGARWRAAVAPIIGLQAITMALRETGALDDDERSLAIDRAMVLIRQHAKTLHDLWRGEPLPASAASILSDARDAVRDAAERGLEWWTSAPTEVGDPTEAAERLVAAGFTGTLWLARPGTRLDANALAAYIRPGGVPAETIGATLIEIFGAQGEVRRTDRHRQAYRPLASASEGDAVVPMDETLPAGAPILEAWIERGARTGRFDRAASESWAQAQRGSDPIA